MKCYMDIVHTKDSLYFIFRNCSRKMLSLIIRWELVKRSLWLLIKCCKGMSNWDVIGSICLIKYWLMNSIGSSVNILVLIREGLVLSHNLGINRISCRHYIKKVNRIHSSKWKINNQIINIRIERIMKLIVINLGMNMKHWKQR